MHALAPLFRRAQLLGAFVLMLACAAPPAAAQPAAGQLRVASAFDPQTMDPHAIALLYHTRVVFQVYESLVARDERFKLEPALAQAWQMLDGNTWRFRLRPGVRFHDGSELTADDVVFSIERALAAPSQRAFQIKGVTGAKKVDTLTVDILLEAPDAVLPEKLHYIGIMNKAWSERHGVQRTVQARKRRGAQHRREHSARTVRGEEVPAGVSDLGPGRRDSIGAFRGGGLGGAHQGALAPPWSGFGQKT